MRFIVHHSYYDIESIVINQNHVMSFFRSCFLPFDSENVNASMDFLDKNIEIQDHRVNAFETFENFDHKNLLHFEQNNISLSILIIHDSSILDPEEYSQCLLHEILLNQPQLLHSMLQFIDRTFHSCIHKSYPQI